MSFSRQFLEAMQIDPEKILPQPESLPDILMEKCAAISVKPDAVKDLVAAMQCRSSNPTTGR